MAMGPDPSLDNNVQPVVVRHGIGRCHEDAPVDALRHLLAGPPILRGTSCRPDGEADEVPLAARMHGQRIIPSVRVDELARLRDALPAQDRRRRLEKPRDVAVPGVVAHGLPLDAREAQGRREAGPALGDPLRPLGVRADDVQQLGAAHQVCPEDLHPLLQGRVADVRPHHLHVEPRPAAEPPYLARVGLEGAAAHRPAEDPRAPLRQVAARGVGVVLEHIVKHELVYLEILLHGANSPPCLARGDGEACEEAVLSADRPEI
mmetsp:Transcript_39152/g.110675  ORF Transcript_39152/g.110675 Transcript_39152/m.110675 type:complete len:262 (-) Transcript_39152:122-907(-)